VKLRSSEAISKESPLAMRKLDKRESKISLLSKVIDETVARTENHVAAPPLSGCCWVIVALSKSYVIHFYDVIHFCHQTVFVRFSFRMMINFSMATVSLFDFVFPSASPSVSFLFGFLVQITTGCGGGLCFRRSGPPDRRSGPPWPSRPARMTP
jgi:hypothetical protein